MGSSKKIKIGYWYSFGIHMGLARGPIDEMISIKVGDKEAWAGSVTSQTSFFIDNPDLFGGEKKEGGIQGQLDVWMGGSDQQILDTSPSYPVKTSEPLGGLYGMYKRMGVAQPHFRGVATLFYTGKICAITPYPKAWKMRIRRALRGWDGDVWYPAKAVISMSSGAIKAMNPAHILVEAATNRDWGRGLDINRLNLDSYKAAADTLYSEGFGLCFRWTRSTTITEFIQNVVNHIGAVQEINRRTGLLELNLVRANYVAANLTQYTYGTGLLDIQDLETPSQDTATNQVIIKYHDPITDEDMVTPPIDNLASIQSNGTNSTTTEYFGIPTAELASQVALRDLQASMGTIKKMTLVMDRRGFDLGPGSVFRIKALDQGIDDMVVRAIKFEDGTLQEGTIRVAVIQDVFGLPSTSYVVPQPVGWIPPDSLPRDPVTKIMREASWRDVITNLEGWKLQSISDTSAYVTGLADKPNGLALGYQLCTGLNAANYEQRAPGDWTPTALIDGAIPLTGQATVINLKAYTDLSAFVVGAAVVVDNEEMVITAVNANAPQITVGRGALDTLPAAHVDGSRIWAYTDNFSFDPHEWLPSQNIFGKFLTVTSTAMLDILAASAPYVSTVGRATRPYPPANLRINSTAYEKVTAISISDSFSVDWSHRDRLSQDDQLFPHTTGNIGPEAGVTYTVQILSTTGVKLREQAGITGTSWVYTPAMQSSDGALDGFTFKLFSVRGGLTSWQSYTLPIGRLGLGYGLGLYLGGSI